MSNIKNITNSLQAILETVNTLPEAGSSSSGGNIETCTVTIRGVGSAYYPTDVAYTTVDSDGNIVYRHDTCSTDSITITCLKNSVVTVQNNSAVEFVDYDKYILFSNSPMYCMYIDGTCTSFLHNNEHYGGSN